METPGFFQQFFGIMGPFRWPMIIIFIFVIALILIKRSEKNGSMQFFSGAVLISPWGFFASL